MLLQPLNRIVAKVSSKATLRTVLVVPFILQIVGMVGLVGYLSFRNGQKSVNDVTSRLRHEITSHIQARLDAFVATPSLITKINQAEFSQNRVNLEDTKAVERYFWQQIQLFKSMTFISFGNVQGEYVAINRHLNDGSLRIALANQLTKRTVTIYGTDSFGNHTKLLQTVPNFDARQRPWYKVGVGKGKPSWYPVYKYAAYNSLGVGVASPIYDQTGFRGVITADFALVQISEFLHSIKIGHSGQAFIMERDGMLVASSNLELPFIVQGKETKRRRAIASQDPLVKATAQYLQERFGDFSKIDSSQQLDFDLKGQRQFLQVLPYKDELGLDWLIVVVLPESDFMAQINANNHTTILLCLAALIVATVVGITTTGWVTKPLMSLNTAAKKIAMGEWEKPVEIKRADEVGELTNSFNSMASQLQASFTQMKSLNEALATSEQRVKQFLDALPVGVIVIDAIGKPYYTNQRAVELLGKGVLPDVTSEQYTETYQLYIAGTDQLYPYEKLSIVRALKGERATADDLANHQGSKVIPLESWGTPVFDEHGNVVYAIAVFQDITNRKQIEEARLQAEQKYRSIFENAIEGIFQTTPDGRFVSVNPALANLYGYDSPQALIAEITDITRQVYVEPNRRQEFIDLIEQHDAVSNFESQVYRQDGSIIWISENARTIRDAEGKVLYYQGFIVDITERKQTEQLLSQYNQTLEQNVEERTQELALEIAERKRTEKALRQSEAQNRAILSAIPDLMFRVNAEGIYLDYVTTNEFIDLSPPGVQPVGKHVSEFLPPYVYQRQLQHLQQALTTGESQVYEQQVWINGKLQYEEVRVVVSGENEVLFMVRDISDRKSAEAQLKAQQAFLRQIIDIVPASIFVKDSEGYFLTINQAGAATYGKTVEEMLGKCDRDFNSDSAQVEEFLATNRDVMQTRQSKTFPAQAIANNKGEIRWYQTVISPFIDAEDQVQGIIGSSTDITQIKQAEQALVQKNEELSQTLAHLQATQQELIQSEKMAALGHLVAGIAHEINTPLGAIRASISNITTALDRSSQELPQLLQQLSVEQQADFFALLEASRHNQQSLSTREERQLKRALKKELEAQGIEDADTVATTLVSMGITQNITAFIPLLQDKNKKFILEAAYHIAAQQTNSQTIKLAVERASKIVFALKSYIHQDSSGQMTNVSVLEGIDVVLTLYHNQLKQGIEVIKDYKEVPTILCYPEELNQVWTNLIHNAIQAMNNKGTLRIAVSQQDNYILVQVTDSGQGIAPDIKSKIFNPFFTTKPAGEGSGLGLNIVKKIIDKHQGRIDVESEPGLTTFSVWLPMSNEQ